MIPKDISEEEINKIQENLCSLKINQIDLNKFDRSITLRYESIAHTFLIKSKETGTFYEASDSFTNITGFLKAMKIYSQLNHPSIKKLIGCSLQNFDKKPDLIYIAEYTKNMSLSRVISDNQRGLTIDAWNDTARLITIYGIASAMKYLHSKNILHRDLTLENIFIDDYLHPKIGGFYISQILNEEDDQKEKKIIGTSNFIAPEILKTKNYSKAIDVFAFAAVVYQIFEEKQLFENLTKEHITYFVAYKNMRPHISDKTPIHFQKLIRSCWSDDPNERPSFDEIVDILESDHNFITDRTDEKLYRSYIEIIHESEQGIDTTMKLNQVFTKFGSIFKDYQEEEEEEEEEEIQEMEILKEIKKVNLKKFEKIELIGKGGFAEIYLIKHKQTGKLYTAKVFLPNEEVNPYFIKELEILSKLSYPSIVKLIGYSLIGFDREPSKMIVTEYLNNGSLEQILNHEKKGVAFHGWNDTMKLITIYGVASAMKYLHSLNILHRDIRPANILLDDFLHPKLIDFNLSEFLNKIGDNENMVGTQYYMAPEIFRNHQYSKKSDVYAFAMLVYEIVSGDIPFKDRSLAQIMYLIAIKKERPKISNEIPEAYKKLIKSCWRDDPNERPSFDEIVDNLERNHEFITDKTDEKLYRSYIEIIHESEQGIDTTMKLNQVFTKYRLDTFYEDNDSDSYSIVSITEHLGKMNSIELKLTSLGIKEIDFDDFEEIDDAGSGSYGKVIQIQHKKTKQIFAAKQLNSENNTELDFLHELEIMSKVNHLLILKLIGYSLIGFNEQPGMFIITEYISNGNLENILDNVRGEDSIEQWDETMKLINIYGIASAMSYLHSHEISHLDLKPLNILINDYLFPIICDFGLSKKMNNINQQINGLDVRSVHYCSPEIMRSSSATSKSDVYSFGMLLYEMITNQPLYVDFSYINIITSVIQKKRPNIDKSIPEVYKRLIRKCWKDDPNKRPSFDSIVTELRENPEFMNLLTDQENKNHFSTFIEIIDDELEGLNTNTTEKMKLFKKCTIIPNYGCISSSEELPEGTLDSENEVHHDTFSTTYSYTDKSSNKQYNATLSNFGFDISKKDQFLNEVKELLKIDHPAIQKFFGFSLIKSKHQSKPLIKNEYIPFKRLYDVIKNCDNESKWNLTKKLINIYGIASALLYLNSNQIPHPTPTLKNILVDSNYQPKLTEIGFFTQPKNSHLASKLTSVQFDESIFYLPPEALDDRNNVNEKSDVYSFGIISYEILSNSFLFRKNKYKQSELCSKITKGDLRPSFDKKIDTNFKDLIDQCLSINQDDRPSLSDIVSRLENDPNFITVEVNKEEFDNYKEILIKYKKSI